LALTELAERAGMPAGIFNIMTGNSALLVGGLCDDSRVVLSALPVLLLSAN